jgi:hypothetical protein
LFSIGVKRFSHITGRTDWLLSVPTTGRWQTQFGLRESKTEQNMMCNDELNDLRYS